MAIPFLEPWTLALAAAAGFAIYTVTVEYGMVWSDGAESPALAAAFYSTLVVTVAFWVLAIARGIPAGSLTIDNVWPFVVAGIAYPAAFRFVYYEGIDRVGSGVTAAIMGGYPAVSVLLAVVWLGEVLDILAGIGVVAIVAGVAILQLTQDSEADIEDVVAEKLVGGNPRDLLYPAAAMLLAGSAFVLIDFGLGRFPDPILATAVTQTPAFVIFFAWAVRHGASGGRLNLGRTAVGAFVLAGAFNFVGWLSQFFALQWGTVITVVPLINTMPLIILAITYGIEREIPRSGRLFAAVVAIVVGATLVQM